MAEKRYLYVKAANGMTARVPEEKLESWKEAQEKLRRGEKVPEAEELRRKLEERFHLSPSEN